MKLYLVRHLPVASHHAGICYGASNLACANNEDAQSDLIARIRALPWTTAITSGLQRCLTLAHLATQDRPAATIDDRWRERDFGAWEMQRWDDIHAAHPTAIDRLMHLDFAPPSGESLAAVVARVRTAMNDLPRNAPSLVISHGGPIAIARALNDNVDLDQLASLILRPGDIVELDLQTT